MKLRIKFRKFGAVRFIGHLDVMRFFQKALRRAEIDVAYTAGYSPHQIMSFAAPLSVGITSDGEYMDIEVHSITSCEDIKNRLNQASVPGIEIVGVSILPDRTGNAMASVAAAAYTVSFREGKEPECGLAKVLPAFLAQEEILITKEGKKGTRQVNIRPGIYELTCTNQASDIETKRSATAAHDSADKEIPVLHMLVDASSKGNIKPVQVIEALLAQNGEDLQEYALLINRDDTYANIGTEENPRFIPLDAVAEENTQENQ